MEKTIIVFRFVFGATLTRLSYGCVFMFTNRFVHCSAMMYDRSLLLRVSRRTFKSKAFIVGCLRADTNVIPLWGQVDYVGTFVDQVLFGSLVTRRHDSGDSSRVVVSSSSSSSSSRRSSSSKSSSS